MIPFDRKPHEITSTKGIFPHFKTKPIPDGRVFCAFVRYSI